MDAENISVIILSVVFIIMAALLLFIAYRQHKEKGFIFTNEWIWASKQEREKMDERVKKVEYRVGRNVFSMLGIVCLILAANFILSISWIFYVCYAIMGVMVVCAIYQTVKNERYYNSIGYRK